MHVKKTPTKNSYRLDIVKKYYDRGVSRQKTVVSGGTIEKLKEQYEDPLAHFKALAKKMTEEEKEREKPYTIEVKRHKKITKNKCLRKHVGVAPLLCIFNSLGITNILCNTSATKRMSFSLLQALRLLVSERLLEPSSKKSAYENKDKYFFDTTFTQADLYRSLDYLADIKQNLITAMNKAIDSVVPRQKGSVFYDVTNYYFETEEDDFRKKGVCKEHRPNPIVQMGLLQDAHGIPLTYRLFSGNTQDVVTMMPVIADTKREFGLDELTVVADKGLNASANMALLTLTHDHFIFSQSIRGTKSDSKLKYKVLSEKGYTYNKDKTFKKKSWQGYKTIHLKKEDTKDGHPKDIEVPVKYVAFWSKDYEIRSRYERAKAISKAKDYIENPGSYTNAKKHGSLKYVEGIAYDKLTGEVRNDQQLLRLNEKAVKEDEVCDGYYLLISSHTEWSEDEIIDAYRGLWQIEESFKITKSDLLARPVYVRTQKHIEAHFLVCYIALTIVRIMQNLITSRPSAKSILDDLRQLDASYIDENLWLLDYRTDLTEEIFSTVGLTHPTRYMEQHTLKELSQKHTL